MAEGDPQLGGDQGQRGTHHALRKGLCWVVMNNCDTRSEFELLVNKVFQLRTSWRRLPAGVLACKPFSGGSGAWAPESERGEHSLLGSSSGLWESGSELPRTHALNSEHVPCGPEAPLTNVGNGHRENCIKPNLVRGKGNRLLVKITSLNFLSALWARKRK